MDLTLNPEQTLLTRTAREYLTRTCTPTTVRALEASPHGFDPVTWRALAEHGWLGTELSTTHGGSALTFLDTVLLAEEMGRVLLPAPFVATTALAAPLLAALGTDAQRDRWLPAIAAGDAVATLAWRDAPTLRLDAGGHLDGATSFVPFAAVAHLLLVVVPGPTLVAVEGAARGLSCVRLATLGGDPSYTVAFDRVAAEPVGSPDRAAAVLARALDRGAIASMAYAVGAAARALEMTVEYAKTRVQFGQPIGSFQAVAHRCVDMQSDVDALRYLVYQAAWAMGRDVPADTEVGAALAYGGEALQRIFAHAHQVHGAIGFSTECDLQLFTRRAKAEELTWGSPALHLERVARAMGL
jgi:alkylation response protein AidB-like acyl-CoA dehydrogenase